MHWRRDTVRKLSHLRMPCHRRALSYSMVPKFTYSSHNGTPLLAATTVSAAFISYYAYLSSNPPHSLNEAPQKPSSSSPYLLRNFIADAVEIAAPAVVNITVHSGYATSAGSGFFIDPNGYIVTNAHVVHNCNRNSKIQITLFDGTKYPATLHSKDNISDLALLKIDYKQPKKWPIIEFGSSSNLRAGEWVCALGNPFTLQNSVSAGIISAVARHSSELGYFRNGEYLQTDAAINTGNSGGPLINLDGQVIGINTMKVAGSVGISFAIPGDIAAQVIKQLLLKGTVTRPFIGVQMANLNRVQVEDKELSGVLVRSVTRGSPACKAGIMAGDVLTIFDGKKVNSIKDVLSLIGFEIGRPIQISVWREREKETKQFTVITETLPAQMRS